MNRKRILVVDDEPLNLKIVRATLSGADHQLDLAENGHVAWARLQAETTPYDLIILDRMMPVMDGITLLHLIKTDPRYLNVPVIMQTAATSPEQVAEGLAAGAHYYLTKPYEPDALLTIVRAALEMQAQRTRLARTTHECGIVRPLLVNAEFRFSTLTEARALAAQLGLLCPHPETASLGLGELLVNAVEHGNLEISYAEKSRLKWEDLWEIEISRRQQDTRFQHRRARIHVDNQAHEIVFTICDEGPGFDWHDYLTFSPDRAFDPNGRGIAMARQMSFSSLEYQGNGNVVVARIARGMTPAETGSKGA